ncbi:hypothetical protein AB0F95_29680 [Micromonospora tulbaghiae]|uniref:hypothetical protein n=1 Tax=Micromonospora tulbaghiae TaxID=479978 RepID=UPI0033FCEB4E
MVLTDVTGSWVGTNGFRLMPADPLAESPAALTVATAAGGHLTTVSYSWHQQPTPMTLTGAAGGSSAVELTAEYGGGWGWRIVLDTAGPALLRLRMENVVPADQAGPGTPAGPYPAMVTDVRRA